MLFINDVINSEIQNKNIKGLNKLEQVKSKIKSVTHVDLTARVQAVSKKFNENFHKLISEFNKITGVPILINTSFNVRRTNSKFPNDAIKCFLGTNLDFLILEDYIIDKKLQEDYLLKSNHSISFNKD